MNYCRICKTPFKQGEIRGSYKNTDEKQRWYCMKCWRKYYHFQNENTSMLSTHGVELH
jgi:transposase-like protein